MAPPSPAMRRFALALISERQIPPCGPYKWEADIRLTIRRLVDDGGRFVTWKDCDTLIKYLKPLPNKTDTAQRIPQSETRPRAPMVKPGCFIFQGRIWVAHERRDKLGVWVEQLVEDVPDRIHDATGDRVNFELVYDQATSIRVVRDLTEEHRMTFAQAKDYVIRYGMCIAPVGRAICRRRLKAAESVAVAMGTVCGPRFPGYHEALEEVRAERKHALYEQARDELGIALSDVQLYRIAGPHVSTVDGVGRKLDLTPANA